jgi:hypothetical protein
MKKAPPPGQPAVEGETYIFRSLPTWGPPPLPDPKKCLKIVTLLGYTDYSKPNGMSYKIGKRRE